ncbi:MAG TPA: PhoX family phosphatase [Thermomicrobiales bacterium]|nr:PhoX family phosphatase [Thermomicrobiales bacterium]
MVRSEQFYEGGRDQVLSTAGVGETMQEVLARRWSRRGMMKSGALAAMALIPAGAGLKPAGAQDATPGATPEANGAAVGGLGFEPIALDTSDIHVVALGHTAVPFLKWGDPIVAGAPEFDLNNQTASAQEQQFGYNCDWIGFFPLPPDSTASDHGLLVVNHEYTNPELMFSGYLTRNPELDAVATPDNAPLDVPEFLANPTQEIVDVELAAHGLSIVEVRRGADGEWEVVRDSEYNRRLTGTTPMEITGPAAGTELLKTNDDPTGTRVLGTLNNCAGGTTPWGTALTGEENFQQYFANLSALPEDDPIRIAHERYGLGEEGSERRWEEFYPRFDLAQEPNEPFRFGWVVEFDPYDPSSTPKKRTALGRNKHEGATHAVAPSGQVAFYTGDDERFDYAYKFVTAGTYNADERAANADLLNEGTLYVAKFNDDGTGEWLPILHGEGPLTEANGFASQAEVLAKTRLAADALGATKMDRPEDFETNPVTGKVYLVLTNNSNRTLEDTDEANPRPNNFAGHIIEITEDGNDHAATTFAWEIFILAGNPEDSGTWYGGIEADLISPLAAPDNLTFDKQGNIWISTDGLSNSLPGNDGLFVAPTEGEQRGRSMQFFSTVPGAECSGPIFNPDNTALFVSVQHPGEGGTFEDPISLWPTGEDVARPSVVVITSDTSTARVGPPS